MSADDGDGRSALGPDSSPAVVYRMFIIGQSRHGYYGRPNGCILFSMKAVPAVVAFGLLVGCSSSGGNGDASAGAATPCDPLAAQPLTLGAVVGVGKDAAGKLYVDSSHGVFVVDNGGTKLVRQHVTGTGTSGTTEFIFSFAAPGADESTAQQLLVETTGSPPTATAMALGPTSSKAFLNQSPAGTTSLTLADASTVSGLAVINTPNVIDYLADVANGQVILATVPMNSDETSSNGGLAIFYGPPNAVAQRPITAFMESLSGNGSVTFLVDGTPYSLAFGNVATTDAGPLGTFSLLGLTPAGGDTLAVTLRSPTPSALPPAFSFSCLP
jgi:hypothetical protein